MQQSQLVHQVSLWILWLSKMAIKRATTLNDKTLVQTSVPSRIMLDSTMDHYKDIGWPNARCQLHHRLGIEPENHVYHYQNINVNVCVQCHIIYRTTPDITSMKQSLKNKCKTKKLSKYYKLLYYLLYFINFMLLLQCLWLKGVVCRNLRNFTTCCPKNHHHTSFRYSTSGNEPVTREKSKTFYDICCDSNGRYANYTENKVTT